MSWLIDENKMVKELTSFKTIASKVLYFKKVFA